MAPCAGEKGGMPVCCAEKEMAPECVGGKGGMFCREGGNGGILGGKLENPEVEEILPWGGGDALNGWGPGPER